MDISFLLLFVIAASFSYLLLRIVQLQSNSLSPERVGQLNRLHALGISWFPKSSNSKKTLALFFSLLTGVFTTWMWSVFGSPLLFLLCLIAVGLFIEELDEPKHLRELPAVLGLVKQVLNEVQLGNDLLVALGKATLALPDSPVKQRVKKTLVSIEERQPPEKSLHILQGINPYLDQFVSDCVRAGWQNSPALEIALELLLQRTSQHWQRTSHIRPSFDNINLYIPAIRSFIAGNMAMGIAILLHQHQPPMGLVATAILVVLVFRFLLITPYLKRTIMVAAVLLMFYAQAFIAQPSLPTLVQAFQHEKVLKRQEIHPVQESQMEPSKIRGIFDLAECTVWTGLANGLANLRSGPGMNYRVLAVIPERETLVYLGQTGNFTQGEWRQVRTNDQIGWMYAPLCQTPAKIEPVSNNSTLVTSLIPISATSASLNVSNFEGNCRIETGFNEGWANLRAGPGMSFNVIATFPESTPLQIIGEKGDFYTSGIWYQVQAVNDTQGWIFKELCNRSHDDEH